jgi:hypothetical protein
MVSFIAAFEECPNADVAADEDSPHAIIVRRPVINTSKYTPYLDTTSFPREAAASHAHLSRWQKVL